MVSDRAVPEPGPHQVLVKTAAWALNPCDWKMPTNFPSPGTGNGSGYSGRIARLGSPVQGSGLKVGDRVAGAVHASNLLDPQAGAYAEYIVVCADQLWRVLLSPCRGLTQRLSAGAWLARWASRPSAPWSCRGLLRSRPKSPLLSWSMEAVRPVGSSRSRSYSCRPMNQRHRALMGSRTNPNMAPSGSSCMHVARRCRVTYVAARYHPFSGCLF